jgi:hypothetical protein
MSATHTNHETKLIENRLAERARFFWTVRETLGLVRSAALATYLLVAVVEGELPGAEVVLSGLRGL